MDIVETVIALVAKHFNLKAFLPRWSAIKELGKGNGLDAPDELIALNLDILSRSFYNINAIQPNSDWVWPYWVEKQYNPKDTSFLPSSYLSINLTNRNWTGFTSPHSDHEAIVDPRGLITPLYDGWSLDYWVRRRDEIIVPSRLEPADFHQSLENKSPIVRSTIYKYLLKITSEALMTEEDGKAFVVAFYHVEPVGSDKIDFTFYISLRPYNPESIIPVFSIDYDDAADTFTVNGSDRVVLDRKPDRVVVSNQEGGDSYYQALTKKPSVFRASDTGGLCNAFAEFGSEVDSLNAFSLKVIVPVGDYDVPDSLRDRSFSVLRSHTMEEWSRKKLGSMKVTTPDSRINEAFEASKNNLLLLVDKEEVTPGPFTYHKMWFRDASYTVTALLKLGFFEDVKRILGFYFRRQKPDGFFESQNGEWDSNGQVLWTMSQYYLFSGDREFLEKHYAALAKGAEWIFKTRKKTTKDITERHWGLLPAGYSAEHFGPSNYYYWDNYWGWAGVRDLIAIGKALGKDVAAMEAENAAYLEDIERSILATQELLGEAYIPSSPYRKKDSSLIATVAAVYPLQMFAPHRADVQLTLKLIRKRFMQSTAFFHKLLHSGYNVYLTAQVAECYVADRSTLALPILEWILDHASNTWTFPEAIHPETDGGCMGDGHHGWASAELLHLIRNMLFTEEGDKLVFFPVIHEHWTEIQDAIRVANAHSHFGTLDFSLSNESGVLEFELHGDLDRPPRVIEINVPTKIEKIVIDGQERRILDRKFELAWKPDLKVSIYR